MFAAPNIRDNTSTSRAGRGLKRVAHNITHGMAGTPLFRVWSSMKNRCANQKVAGYKDYGGRGVSVCERWKSFENFYADMGDRPSDKHSLERRDNDGNYEPSNCYWATKAEQAKNRRNTKFIEANGERLHLAEWARKLGCSPATILHRIAVGMPEAEAVTKVVTDRPTAKLTVAQALEIRELYPSLSAQKLADKYAVSKKSVLNVIHRKTFFDI